MESQPRLEGNEAAADLITVADSIHLVTVVITRGALGVLTKVVGTRTPKQMISTENTRTNIAVNTD